MDWMAARQFHVIEHLPCSSDLALADFFLFPKVKRELADLTLTPRDLQEGVGGGHIRTLKAANFTTAFELWHECCEKFIDIVSSYVEKS
jgi:coproporphyrinogen III oxidase